VRKTSYGCWLWQGAKTEMGYGQITVATTTDLLWARGHHRRPAHRVAWELTYGPLQVGQSVRQECDEPACCRPEHLVVRGGAASKASGEAPHEYTVPGPDWPVELHSNTREDLRQELGLSRQAFLRQDDEKGP
jgi:hypothetical protein